MATQTGTGKARDRNVLRSRLDALYTTSPIWWSEDTSFVEPAHTSPPSAPASFLRPQYGRSFGARGTVTGAENRSGAWSLLLATQARPGMNDVMAAAEVEIRSLADPTQNDNAEDVWTDGSVEVHDEIASLVPQGIASDWYWTQFIVPYTATEIGR